VAKTLDEALPQLKREPGQPVRAAELFAEIGPWEGETTVGRS
jgi:hypothetical protein